MSASMRADRLLANMGYGSRREMQELAANKRITLDGAPLLKADTRLKLDADLPVRLMIDGVAIDPLPGLTLMMHKPLGVTCSHKEVGPLIYDILPERWRTRSPALSTIGRLDKETSGLIFITDDGALLHRAIAPKSQLEKCYRVTLEKPLNGTEEAVFMSGTLMLEGETKPLLPAGFTAEDATHATVILTEGRYHQVRRMFAAVDNNVVALHRDRFGATELPDDLKPGDYRVITHPEALLFTK